jgi:hypothetical protein
MEKYGLDHCDYEIENLYRLGKKRNAPICVVFTTAFDCDTFLREINLRNLYALPTCLPCQFLSPPLKGTTVRR